MIKKKIIETFEHFKINENVCSGLATDKSCSRQLKHSLAYIDYESSIITVVVEDFCPLPSCSRQLRHILGYINYESSVITVMMEDLSPLPSKITGKECWKIENMF